MKQLLVFMVFLSAWVSAAGQKTIITNYVSITDSDTTKIIWEDIISDNGRQITIVIGPQTTVIWSGVDYITQKCHIRDDTRKTDVTITQADGRYHVQGMFKGKSYQDDQKSSGRQWVQNISYSVGALAHEKGDFEYECFRPDNLAFSEMKASVKSTETFRSSQVKDVKITPAGLKAAFWSCHYYLNDRWEYVGYRGVNGGPGTPETIMYRVE